MAWTGILQHGPLDGSEGTVKHPHQPPQEMWPMRCGAPGTCAFAQLVPGAAAECEEGEVHWLSRRHPALAGRQHCYERVGTDTRNRRVYRYPDGILPGQAIFAEPAILVTAPEPMLVSVRPARGLPEWSTFVVGGANLTFNPERHDPGKALELTIGMYLKRRYGIGGVAQ